MEEIIRQSFGNTVFIMVLGQPQQPRYPKRNYDILNRRVGLRVAKYFETDIFYGQVTKVCASDSQNDKPLYHIEYEDGDSEDFDMKELQEGVTLYFRTQNVKRYRSQDVMQKRRTRKRKHMKEKEQFMNGTSHSFEPLFDKATPIHTLILGTHPARKSLKENRYFDNPSNVFWWVAGDCLGFRRDKGERSDGEPMKLCEHLRYDESFIVPYEKQVNIFCQHGFALWDIVASCQRKGSIDSAIRNDKPNDIKNFVNQNPTIKNIVLANGKSGLALFTKHFSEWFESGELVLHEPGRVSSQLEASNANVKKDELKGKLG